MEHLQEPRLLHDKGKETSNYPLRRKPILCRRDKLSVFSAFYQKSNLVGHGHPTQALGSTAKTARLRPTRAFNCISFHKLPFASEFSAKDNPHSITVDMDRQTSQHVLSICNNSSMKLESLQNMTTQAAANNACQKTCYTTEPIPARRKLLEQESTLA